MRRAFASSNFRRASRRGSRKWLDRFPDVPLEHLSALGPVLGLSAADGCSPFQQLDHLGSIAGVFDLAQKRDKETRELNSDWLVLPELGCSPWRSKCIMLLKKVFRSWHCGLHMIATQLHQCHTFLDFPRTFWWLLMSTWSLAFSVKFQWLQGP